MPISRADCALVSKSARDHQREGMVEGGLAQRLEAARRCHDSLVIAGPARSAATRQSIRRLDKFRRS